MPDLAAALAGALDAEAEDDGSLTVRYRGTVASLRTVDIADGLEMVSLTQMLGWDLPLDAALRDTVAALAHSTLLGTVTLAAAGTTADVMLRYNFPAGGLDAAALQTLVLMVLDAGADARAAL